jgi:hypothetical protein
LLVFGLKLNKQEIIKNLKKHLTGNGQLSITRSTL